MSTVNGMVTEVKATEQKQAKTRRVPGFVYVFLGGVIGGCVAQVATILIRYALSH